MNYPFAKSVFTAALLLACVATAQAMPIWQFDKMTQDDRAEYISELIEGAQKTLNDAGQHGEAQAVHKLFTTDADNGVSVGMNQFMMTLALVRVSDAKRVAKDANAARLQVEHVMIIALKNNGIVLPKSFMTVAKDFKPKHAPDDKK